jgi:hypothetical protein
MRRIGDEMGGIGAKRVWHGSQEQGEQAVHRPGMCSAHGCPLPGAISTGGDSPKYCWLHFGAGVDANDRITSWLRRRPLVVEALWVTEAWSEAQIDALGVRLDEAGLGDIAPQIRVLSHEGYGRHGEGLSVTRDERKHPKLFMQRVRGWVSTQIGAIGRSA